MKVSIEQVEEGYKVEAEQEVAPMPGAMEAEQEMGQTFATLDGALNYVREQFGTGEAPVGEEKPMMEGEADFVSGFKQARGIERGF